MTLDLSSEEIFRPDFEIAMLSIDALQEDIDEKKVEAQRISDMMFELGQQGNPQYKHGNYGTITPATIQLILVAIDRVKHGEPKRWFDCKSSNE